MDRYKIFFSHSSKDKKFVSRLKELYIQKTFNTVDFFVSSDGESIKLGTDSRYTVIESLKDCHKLFVFITPNSLESNWVMFESGFAHANGIEIVPICCLGATIQSIPDPIEVFQGINLYSKDDLNSLLNLINIETGAQFPLAFTEAEWDNAQSQYPIESLKEYIKNQEYTFIASRELLNKCFEFLKLNNIPYTYIKENKNLLLPKGLLIQYSEIENNEVDYNYTFYITPEHLIENYNFINSYLMYFNKKYGFMHTGHSNLKLKIYLNNEYHLENTVNIVGEKIEGTDIKYSDEGRVIFKDYILTIENDNITIESIRNKMNNEETFELIRMLARINILRKVK